MLISLSKTGRILSLYSEKSLYHQRILQTSEEQLIEVEHTCDLNKTHIV